MASTNNSASNKSLDGGADATTGTGEEGLDSSAGSMRTRRRPMSTRSRSPMPPPGGGGGGVAATAAATTAATTSLSLASGGGAATGTRSSGRRSGNSSSNNKLVMIDSSGDSGKEEEVVAAAAAGPPARKRGRPPKSTTSTATSSAGTTALEENNDDANHNQTDTNDTTNNEEEEETKEEASSSPPSAPSSSPSKPKPLVLLGSQPRGLYECDYCGSDLTRTPRIRCATCPDFDLCLECFATEDHEHMARYKRQEEEGRRAEAAKLAGVDLLEGAVEKEEKKVVVAEKSSSSSSSSRGRGGKMSRGRSGSKGTDKNNSGGGKNKKEEDPNDALGSYVGGVWVPYFRHHPDHGYLVADSTRYMLFPSFRGVKKQVVVDVVDGERKDGNVEAIVDGGGAAKDDESNVADQSIVDNEGKTESSSPVDEGSVKSKRGDDKEQNKEQLSNDAMDVEKVTQEEGESEITKGDGPDVEKAETTTSKDSMDVDSNAKEDGEAKKENGENDGSKDAMDVDSKVNANDGVKGGKESGDKSSAEKSAEEDSKVNANGGVKGEEESEDKSSAEKSAEEATMTEAEDKEAKSQTKKDEFKAGEKTEEMEPKAGEKKEEESAQPTSDNLDTNAAVKNDVDATNNENNSNADQSTKPQPQKYRVIDDSKNAWTAEEDLRLLDGILTCGLGNWPDIAEHVANGGTNGEGTTSSSGDGGSNNNNIGGGGGGNGVVGGGKTDKKCMERFLDDFMGRYGHIFPPYTMVPVPEGEEGSDDDNNKKEDADAKPAAGAAAASATSESDGESGVAARKRPRRSVNSSVVEDDSSAPGFKKTKFRVVPTEELEECQDLWPHPYVPKVPETEVKKGDEVGRDLWYRSEQSFVRQTTSASCSKIDAETIRKEFIERRSQNLAGYEAKVLPPRLDDQKNLPGAELAGYMPRRGDFDMEWENDAEKIISEMEFSAEDTKADRDLKLEVIRIFNSKLNEREKRKKFVIDQKLLNYRENQEKMWKMAPDERHLVQRMRMFARFHDTPEEHEAFVNKIIDAKRLRKEIAKLQTYRRLGITSLADAERYEIDKARRELHRSAWMKKEEEKRKAAEEAVRAAKENATIAGVAPPAPAPVPPPVVGLEGSGSVPVAMANQSLQVWKQFKRSTKESSSDEKKTSSGEDTDINKESVKFIIKDKPGYELLSKKEVGLCKRLRILPRNYLDVKKALISESLAQGIWNPSTAGQRGSRSIFKIDVSQRDDIIDFVLEAGWIVSRPNIV